MQNIKLIISKLFDDERIKLEDFLFVLKNEKKNNYELEAYVKEILYDYEDAVMYFKRLKYKESAFKFYEIRLKLEEKKDIYKFHKRPNISDRIFAISRIIPVLEYMYENKLNEEKLFVVPESYSKKRQTYEDIILRKDLGNFYFWFLKLINSFSVIYGIVDIISEKYNLKVLPINDNKEIAAEDKKDILNLFKYLFKETFTPYYNYEFLNYEKVLYENEMEKEKLMLGFHYYDRKKDETYVKIDEKMFSDFLTNLISLFSTIPILNQMYSDSVTYDLNFNCAIKYLEYGGYIAEYYEDKKMI